MQYVNVVAFAGESAERVATGEMLGDSRPQLAAADD